MNENLAKILAWGENRKIQLGALFGIFILSSLLLFMPGITIGHDIFFHLLRVAGLADELKRGNFPVRLQSIWFDGYGYPVSIYYGDLLLYFPAVLHFLGLSLTRAFSLYLVAINAATTLISYECFKRIFKSRNIGLLVCLVYTTASYRLLDIFVRSAVGEFSSFLFFPIVALAFYNLFSDSPEKNFKTALLLAAGMSGLVLTHILSTEMCALILLLISLFFLKKVFSKKIFLTLLSAVFLTLLFCAFFIVPLIDYSINVPVKITQMTEKHIQSGGIYFSQLFAFFQNPFGYDSSSVRDRMLFSPGMPLMAGLVFSIIYLVYYKKDKELSFFLMLSVFTLFISSSRFPWDKIASTKIGMLISQIQFSWRWLGMATVALTLLLGRLLVLHDKNHRVVWGSVICMAILQTTAFTSIYINQAGNYGAKDYTEFGSNWSIGDEYIRLGTDIKNLSGEIETNNIKISNLTRNANSFQFHAKGIEAGFVELPIFNYKGYTAVYGNGKKLAVTDGKNNVVRIVFPENFDSDVSVRFEEPLLWRIASIVSLCSVVLVLCFLLNRKIKTKSIAK